MDKKDRMITNECDIRNFIVYSATCVDRVEKNRDKRYYSTAIINFTLPNNKTFYYSGYIELVSDDCDFILFSVFNYKHDEPKEYYLSLNQINYILPYKSKSHGQKNYVN